MWVITAITLYTGATYLPRSSIKFKLIIPLHQTYESKFESSLCYEFSYPRVSGTSDGRRYSLEKRATIQTPWKYRNNVAKFEGETKASHVACWDGSTNPSPDVAGEAKLSDGSSVLFDYPDTPSTS